MLVQVEPTTVRYAVNASCRRTQARSGCQYEAERVGSAVARCIYLANRKQDKREAAAQAVHALLAVDTKIIVYTEHSSYVPITCRLQEWHVQLVLCLS